jgi:hypothetical protein
VSDPLCHPPITVPRPVFGGRSVPFVNRGGEDEGRQSFVVYGVVRTWRMSSGF